MSYWLAQSELDSHDLEQIGLTLASRSGEFFVVAVATKNGGPTLDGVQTGDKLLKIDSLPTQGAARSEVLNALHGNPGEVQILILERDNQKLTIPARVTAF